jgi:hypothetical protein
MPENCPMCGSGVRDRSVSPMYGNPCPPHEYLTFECGSATWSHHKALCQMSENCRATLRQQKDAAKDAEIARLKAEVAVLERALELADELVSQAAYYHDPEDHRPFTANRNYIEQARKELEAE